MCKRRFYVNVAYLMLPSPRLKRTVVVNDGEWLPIISVEVKE